jgi:hypothetical protein
MAPVAIPDDMDETLRAPSASPPGTCLVDQRGTCRSGHSILSQIVLFNRTTFLLLELV